jgi:hypothetical protein
MDKNAARSKNGHQPFDSKIVRSDLPFPKRSGDMVYNS